MRLFARRRQREIETERSEAADRLYRALRWKEALAFADELRFARELYRKYGESDYLDQLVADGPNHSLSDQFRPLSHIEESSDA